MKQITISLPDNKLDFLIELLQQFKGVEILEEGKNKTNKAILKNVKQGLHQVKLVQNGKLKSKPARKFLDEL